jgi:hypothetical protein
LSSQREKKTVGKYLKWYQWYSKVRLMLKIVRGIKAKFLTKIYADKLML